MWKRRITVKKFGTMLIPAPTIEALERFVKPKFDKIDTRLVNLEKNGRLSGLVILKLKDLIMYCR